MTNCEFGPPPRPEEDSLAVLTGQLSEPLETKSYKPGEESRDVTVRLIESGAGLMGLESLADFKDRAGLNNHFILSARLGTHLTREFQKKGYETNSQDVLNALLDSHLGRIIWEQAKYYRDVVPDAEKTAQTPNELIGVNLLKEAGIRKEITDIVKGLAHGHEANRQIYLSWDYRLASYADHRASQNIEPLYKRMAEFLMRNFFKRDTLNEEKKQEVYTVLKDIVLKGREKEINSDEAIKIVKNLGAEEISERLDLNHLMELVLEDAETEAELIKIGINPDELNNNNPPEARWERYLRRLYIHDAEEEIFEKLDELQEDQEQLEKEFPLNTWWGQYVRELYKKQQGRPYQSKHGKASGIQRAIESFRYLDQMRKRKQEKQSEEE